MVGDTYIEGRLIVTESTIIQDTSTETSEQLIIINNGNATGKDIMNLAGEMSATVYDRYGISLKPEVKIIDS